MSKYDIIFVLPYPFSHHPSFPEGLLKRNLEIHGFRVGVLETPFWQSPESFTRLGAPELFFAIIPGPVDSVVLNYTSTRKRRREDSYQKEGKAFFDGYPPSIKYKIRPDLAVVVFANRLRQVFKETPIVVGGMEASLRCFAHYDFQREKIKRSILLDSRADLAVTGMGEKQLLEIAVKAKKGSPLQETDLRGTARIVKSIDAFPGYVALPPLEEIITHPAKLLDAALKSEAARMAGNGVYQQQGDRYVVEHPCRSYSPRDLDAVYGLDYSRMHSDGTISSPALDMNLFSVTAHRGCGGGCAFCSISRHEGKRIISRSRDSILAEIESFNRHPRWQGIVPDIGGATAELFGSDCHNQECRRASCFLKTTCPTIRSTSPYLHLLRDARRLKGVRKIFLGSGIRYDLVLQNPDLLEEIMVHHSGKFLRVAPEHTETPVLDLMRKTGFHVFEEFVALFNRINRNLKRKIELAPYLIVGHPGEDRGHVINMARRLRQLDVKTTDVQIFTPTPGTLATAMYYAEMSPGFERIPVEKNIKELMKRKTILASAGPRTD